MGEIKTKTISLCGISIAIIIICLYAGAIIRNNRIFFVAAATIIGGIPYIKGELKYGFLTYIASSILAFFLVPNKFYTGIYIILGIYPLIKIAAERYSVPVEFIIKFLWFNLAVLIIYIIFKNVIYINEFFMSNGGKILIVIGLEFLFLLYDYVFSTCINYLRKRILRSDR